MEQAWPYIIGVAQLLGMLLLYFHQRNIIKVQKEALEAQKNTIDGMKSFHDIFDMETVEGYVQIIKKKSQSEVDELQKLKAELEAKHADAATESDFWQSQWDDYRMKNREALTILIIALYYYERDDAESLIRNRMPLNQEVMLAMLSEIKQKHPLGLKKRARRRSRPAASNV